MIASIRGRLIAKEPTSAVIETGGIGLRLHIPFSTFERLGEVGGEISLFTHLHVREDALQLYGFALPEERDLFLLLITVSGVGPKLAQTILSGMPVATIREAIREGDTRLLARIPGVGKKIAERLVVELRDKLGGPEEPGHSARIGGVYEEAVLALVSLGYRCVQAEEAVGAVLQQEGSIPIEILIRKALGRLSPMPVGARR